MNDDASEHFRPRSAPPEKPRLEAGLKSLHGRLQKWLNEAVYPLWSLRGIDSRDGSFFEGLTQSGEPLRAARRVRVQPRQVFAFAKAPELGWHGDVGPIVQHGIDSLIATYRRDDGLFATLAGPGGEVIDTRALLYDQAFVLHGFAAAGSLLGQSPVFERQALALFSRIERCWKIDPGVYRTGELAPDTREANPHMHLLEACIGWARIGADPIWAHTVDALASVALRHFVDARTGLLSESFTSAWDAAPGLRGQIVEPGHVFEWAWLLLQCPQEAAGLCALRLIALAEALGIRDGVAVNAILKDGRVHDERARLWPQTERLKATLRAAQCTGDARYLTMAAEAAASLLPYLDTERPGLWWDTRLPGARFIAEPAPASTLYHLVSAVIEFRELER